MLTLLPFFVESLVEVHLALARLGAPGLVYSSSIVFISCIIGLTHLWIRWYLLVHLSWLTQANYSIRYRILLSRLCVAHSSLDILCNFHERLHLFHFVISNHRALI